MNKSEIEEPKEAILGHSVKVDWTGEGVCMSVCVHAHTHVGGIADWLGLGIIN